VDLAVEDVDAVRELRKRHAVVWLNVDGLGDAATVQRVGEVFGLHNLALEDVLNVGQRPKVEDYSDHIFLVTRMPRPDTTAETEQVTLFVGKGFLVTFQETPGDCLESVRERIRQGRPRLREGGADYLAYAVLDTIVDSYFPLLGEVGDQLEALEARILSDPEPEVISRLHDLKRDLTAIRRVILPIRESLTALVRDESPLVSDSTRLYFRDCLDHSFQLIELVESNRDIASGLLDLHLTMMSNRMNEVMKVLTIIATIFIPLGFIAGLYGMNFDPSVSRWNMPELSWKFGYFFALGVMATVAAAMVMYFRRRKWL